MNQPEPHSDRPADAASEPAELAHAAPNDPQPPAPSGAAPFGAKVESSGGVEPPTPPVVERTEIVIEPERSRAHPLAPDPAPSESPSAAEASARSIGDELASAPLFAGSSAAAAARPTEPVIRAASEAPAAAPAPPPAPPAAHAVPPPPRPAPEPTPARPRIDPKVEEVTAVRVTRFESPAPTIDVQAQRPAPKSPEPARAAPSASSPPPAGAGAASSMPPAGAGGSVPPGGGAGGSAGGAGAAATSPSASHGRFWAAASHLLLIPVALTFYLGGVITFLIWQLAGRDDAFAEDQAREALNFQINVAVLSAVLTFSCIGSPLLVVLVPASWVLCIIAAVRASNGERYRYPFIWRVVTH